MIELKRIKGGKISEEQKAWIEKLNHQQYAAVFCYGWEDAWNVIKAYLTNRNGIIAAAVKGSLEKVREGKNTGGTNKA